jgi:hypothetical protein
MGGAEVKPNWLKEVFRNAEGEGAGGASGQLSGEGAQPAPTDDKLSALESRLDRITQTFESQTSEQRQRSAQQAIQGRANQLDQAKRAAEAAVGAAEQTLADAFDNGEGIEIAKAQRALTEAIAKRERADVAIENFKDQIRAAEHRAKPDLDDSNLRSWKAKHSSWYGVDAEMTKASHEVDRQIRAAGVLSVGSKEYFEAIDRTMSQRYPDKFGGTPPTSGQGGGHPTPNSSRRGRISQSIADGWRRMGIDMSDPKVVDRMVQNRQRAVEKGILPEQPVTGAIVTR